MHSLFAFLLGIVEIFLHHINGFGGSCDLGILEDPNHFIMQCPKYEGIRSEMIDVIGASEED